MADSKPISMHLDQNLNLRADEGQVLEDVTMHQKIVGSLIYYLAARYELHSCLGELVYETSQEATLGCSEVHTTLCEC